MDQADPLPGAKSITVPISLRFLANYNKVTLSEREKERESDDEKEIKSKSERERDHSQLSMIYFVTVEAHNPVQPTGNCSGSPDCRAGPAYRHLAVPRISVQTYLFKHFKLNHWQSAVLSDSTTDWEQVWLTATADHLPHIPRATPATEGHGHKPIPNHKPLTDWSNCV